MNQHKLPADSSATVLGIISLVIAITLGCCGFSIIGVILAIIGLVSANKSLSEFAANPEAYYPNSRGNVQTAKILNIIGLILNGIITLIFLGYLLLYGTFLFTAINQARTVQESWEEESGYYYDDSETEEDVFIEENDSLYHYQDSLQVEETE